MKQGSDDSNGPSRRMTLSYWTPTAPFLGPIARRMLAPIAWPMFAVVAAGGVVLLWVGLYPRMYYMAAVALLLMTWWLIGLLYIVREGGRIICMYRYGIRDIESVVARRWGVLLLIPVVLTLLIGFKVPLHLGFLISRPGLENLVSELHSGASPFAAGPRRAGIYTIQGERTRRPCHVPGRIILITANDPKAAFVYSPQPIQDDLCYNPGSHGHLRGAWYWYSSD